MKKCIMLLVVLIMIPPSAFAYKSINTTRYSTAYVQEGNQNLC